MSGHGYKLKKKKILLCCNIEAAVILKQCSTVGSACSTMHCQWGLMKNTALVTKLNIHFSRPYSMSVDPKK